MIDSPERLRSNDVIKAPGENKGLQEASCRGDDEGMVYLKTGIIIWTSFILFIIFMFLSSVPRGIVLFGLDRRVYVCMD